MQPWAVCNLLFPTHHTVPHQMHLRAVYTKILKMSMKKIKNSRKENSNYSLSSEEKNSSKIRESRKVTDKADYLTDADIEISESEIDKFKEYDKPITLEDVETLRSIGRKNINQFSQEDIEKAQKWAYKFYKEFGTKSPFFRAWFGDWRAHDNKNQVVVVDIPKVATEKQRSSEGVVVKDIQNVTGFWKVRISGHGERNTRAHSGNQMKSVAELTNIKELMENSILLDSEVHEHHNNNAVNDYIAFDHKFYALGKNESNSIALYKITVEEIFQSKTNTNEMRFHNLRYIPQIEKVVDNVSGSSNSNNENQPYTARDISTTKYSVADLYRFVKCFDRDFLPNPVNPLLLNKDGTPKIFYHGTTEKFTTFVWALFIFS